MHLIQTINQFLWSYPLLFLLMGTHLYFTIRSGFIQKKVFRGIRMSVTAEPAPRPRKNYDAVTKHAEENGMSGFRALMTTLAATIGTGNIIGMSTAVALGGPGAVFWCWLTGVLGMATSYGECYLAHFFRKRKSDDSSTGGAMYIFRFVLKKPLLALIYAGAVVAASLFIGCACQSNSIAITGASAFGLSPVLTGLLCAILFGAVLLGGRALIGRICSVLVPVMGIFYIICCIYLLILTKNSIQPALKLIVCSAFSKESLTGGILGGGLAATLRYGIARGLFTNEAGIGTAGITAACADTDSSPRQALISMTGVFWDTVIMCGITGLVIVASFLDQPSRILGCSAGELTLSAFSRLPHGEQLLSVSLILFALSTMIGWFFLGEQAYTFLTENAQALCIYKCVYLVFLFCGAILSLDLIWELTDLFNLCLLLPNLYLLWRLRKKIMF